jgi:hypothetical protein
MVPVEETKLRVNYFKGNDQSKWHCDVPTSQAVLYKNLYKNVDLKVYGIEKQIEYDWIVKPGGNPGDIRFEYQNVKGTRLDEKGNLLIETEFGELMHKRPVGCQEINMERKKVNVQFKKIAKNIYGFEVSKYHKNVELIIDPVVLAYSTYLGGGSYECGKGIAVDGSGYAYVTGFTSGSGFPTLNQYQASQGLYDVFVTKIDTTESGASSLVYSTYLGGGNTDLGYGIAVDGSENVYVTGFTVSTDFPTLNQYQADQAGDDAFVTRIDTTQSGLSSLIYSSYLGGGDADRGFGIAVDNSGNAYATGYTSSSNFPILNQFQTTLKGWDDVFVTRVDTTQTGASSLIYSTYLGGWAVDRGHGIAVDSAGYAYVTGYTSSSDFPVLNQYQTFQAGTNDAFVTKIDTTESGISSLIYSTFLGGSSSDVGGGIAVDNSGNAYVTGDTWSANFPTLNQYQTYQAGEDVFVTKIDTTQSGASCLIYSTYLGGADNDYGRAAALDNNGNAYVTGETYSTDFPTLNQFQTDQTERDSFVAKIDATQSGGSSLIYSTYLGGGSRDYAYGIAVDNYGNAYLIGETWSTDFPILDQYQTDQGGIDAFVTKLGPFPIGLPAVTTAPVSSVTVISASSGGDVISDGGVEVTAKGVCWSISQNSTIDDNYTTDGAGTGSFTSSLTDLTPSTTYYVRAYATNLVGTAYGNEETFETLAPSITVTAPNGGENWNVGSLQTITWTSDGVEGNVLIEYSFNNGTSWKTIVQSTGNDGTYNWKIPYQPSDNCLVRISETGEDGSPSDVSDAVFSIVSPVTGTLTIRSPNGGETWLAGSTRQIKWNSTGTINNVTIKYSTDNGTTWKTIVQTTTNDGSYNWVVPGKASDKCLVRVAANDSDPDPKPSDVSDAVFSIILPPSPTIRVTAPNGGEQLVVGSQFTITWDAANTREDVQIEYSINGGQNWREITAASGNNGKYDWTVPDAPSDNCLVRISETDGQPSDVSDEIFSIVSPTPGDITVTSPNGGETWTAGSTQQIKWTSTGGIDGVKIEYSPDHGTTWKTIVLTTPNSGEFDWTVPGIASDECLVRITSNDVVNDPIPSDVSDAVFSIVPPASPTITIIAPNGGEQLTVGSSVNITWNAVNSREDVKIEYSINGGQPWLLITDAADNNGDYEWIVPDTPSETCLVRVSEIDGQPVDVSDAVFSIVEPVPGEITVTAPNGGESCESWTAGVSYEITWTAGGINNVTIECSIDYGTTWQVIVHNTGNDGTFDWIIPDAVSDECLVRVSANDGDPDPVPSDISDEVFSIVPDAAGEFRVTSPNGGESWEVGSVQSIEWTNSGDINSVMIEYSYDNGNTWNIIASSVSNSGNYDWQVPDTVSEECLVRITANDGDSDPKLSDVSDSEFSIVLPSSPTIRIITPNGGEQLVIGSIYQITWFGTDSRAEVKIEYSINGGETWTEIIGSTENDGDHDWLVPDEPSETCLVRISEIDGQPVDVSDAVFSIVSPLPGDLTVLTPNGGENLETGSEYNISWTCSGLNNVIIEYSVNNGVTWLYIDKVPADNGSYTWTVPGTTSENCLVRITGADSDENPSDVSDEVFTIFDPSQASIEVFTPNGGESLSVGEEYYITWASTGINNVLIEYSTNNGEQWIPIDTVPAIGGRFTWPVPDTPSESCLIRISAVPSGEPLDMSDAVFSIISN